jgi:hypothetical protein
VLFVGGAAVGGAAVGCATVGCATVGCALFMLVVLLSAVLLLVDSRVGGTFHTEQYTDTPHFLSLLSLFSHQS